MSHAHIQRERERDSVALGLIKPISPPSFFFSSTRAQRQVEAFIEEIMPGDEVKITVGRAGERGAVNEDVRQHTHIVNSDEDKLSWLLQELPGMIDEGDVLIFGSTRIR